MIFGMLPLAFAIGAGAEMRAPMARAVIGGLVTSTLLSLLVVPVVYTLLDDFRPLRVWDWVTLAPACAGEGNRRHRGACPAGLIGKYGTRSSDNVGACRTRLRIATKCCR